MAPYWLTIYLPLLFLIVRLAQNALIARIAQLSLKTVAVPHWMSRNQMTKPAQPLPALPFHHRGTQESSLEYRHFSRNSSSLSEHFLFFYKIWCSLYVFHDRVTDQCNKNPFPYSSDILKPNLGHMQTATLDKAKFMIFLICGKFIDKKMVT